MRLSAEDGSLPAGDDSWRPLQLSRGSAVALDYNHRYAGLGYMGGPGTRRVPDSHQSLMKDEHGTLNQPVSGVC